MMIKYNIIPNNIIISSLYKPKTKFNVIICNRHILIKPIYFIKLCSIYEHTSSRNNKPVIIYFISSEIIYIIIIITYKCMNWTISNIDNTNMLNFLTIRV